MSVQITYFVHATTTDNEQDLATGALPGKLSEIGLKQAAELGRQVSDQQFDVVFCSDLQRAIDSAELAFGDKYTILPDARLQECDYGEFNGKPAAIFKQHMTDYVTEAFPGGESYLDVERRISSFLDFLRSEYDGKHVAIVAHQAPQLALDVLLRQRTWEQAIAEDWRLRKAYQPGWAYTLPT